ncbi:MAG: YaiO family outer membrane beta-barrel protein [Chitinophagaceae bacterium]
MMKRTYGIRALMALLFTTQQLAAQTPSADELLAQARQAAFDQKNYELALTRCRQALAQSPGYTDIRVFMGRIFYWNDQPDSARLTLHEAVTQAPDHEDASVAAASISYFIDDYAKALAYCDNGLQYHRQSKELRLLKVKILIAQKQYRQALTLTDSLLQQDPPVEDARILASRIKDYRSKNRVGISYDYTHFAKQFDQAWHLMSIDYSRQTALGSFTARVNYGNRFGESGGQVELDAYPTIARNVYAYVNLGYSPDRPIFPQFRSGFSLYVNLPKSFEADAGFRYLHFSEDTWIYTGSLGKYYKNWWFNLRAYLTPASSRISQSYSATARYYLSGADDYLSLSVGSGLSPDDRSQAVLLNSNYKLLTRRASAAYYFSYKKLNLFSLGIGWANVEYLPKTRDNQVNASFGYHRRF